MKKKSIVILAIIISIIIILLWVSRLLTIQTSTKHSDSMYTVVVHNDTPYVIDECKTYTEFTERKLYSTEASIQPGEYRKINIEPISGFESTNNVYVEFCIDEKIIAKSSAGYFSYAWGGFEAVKVSYDEDNGFSAQYYNNASSRYYNKLNRRHRKNPDEKSWF